MPTATEIQGFVDAGRAELRKTTITYPDFVSKVKSGYYKRKGIDPVTGSAWGRAYANFDHAYDALGGNPPPPPPPPPPSPSGSKTLDVFRCFIDPGAYEQTQADHLAFAWANFHSDRTPRKSLNGDAVARYIGDGDRFFICKGMKLVKAWPGRWLNFHNVAGDPGWDGVSATAFDLHSSAGVSGMRHEVVNEYERVQDTDLEPHSGGAHFGLPDTTLTFGNWHWYGIDYKAGRNETGWFRVYDWTTGTLLAKAEGINTLKDDSRLQQLWEGAYDGSGVPSEVEVDHAPALFSTKSFADCLTDAPVLVNTWHAQGPSPVSHVEFVDKVTVPAIAPLLTAAA